MTVRVVAGFIEKDGKVLVVKRPTDKKRGGFWEFPGGKVEAGESLQEALRRELKEELGIEVRVGEVLEKIRYIYPDEEIELYLLSVAVNRDLDLKESLEVKWVDLQELENLELCPADKVLLSKLTLVKNKK
ncbi:MAG TPA: 8-oxo-dGTP diphosphatase MutT [Thermodesulfobacterium commune]|uniref:(deoxy)nucleoside triphosphate pyrophosphohydrolase n=1 Tax=Thermodesulfobacterium commune TaxID=1741 RepID=UPI000746C40C|nr:MAG: NUDIX hydrolase [Thermodesulfobacterium commune]HCE80610.1 8-oxo-dGTP diphosphatase MutT [Thermodesulfobacterium commune]HCP10166.1 8-oxo-dGTP diphosphatase MutT [Thermodesulfobacterium commune]